MPAGTVLRLAKEDWRYGGFELLLRVECLRDDLSSYYGHEWAWFSGQRLARDGTPLGQMDVLTKVSALPRTEVPPYADNDPG